MSLVSFTILRLVARVVTLANFATHPLGVRHVNVNAKISTEGYILNAGNWNMSENSLLAQLNTSNASHAHKRARMSSSKSYERRGPEIVSNSDTFDTPTKSVEATEETLLSACILPCIELVERILNAGNMKDLVVGMFVPMFGILLGDILPSAVYEYDVTVLDKIVTSAYGLSAHGWFTWVNGEIKATGAWLKEAWSASKATNDDLSTRGTLCREVEDAAQEKLVAELSRMGAGDEEIASTIGELEADSASFNQQVQTEGSQAAIDEENAMLQKWKDRLGAVAKVLNWYGTCVVMTAAIAAVAVATGAAIPALAAAKIGIGAAAFTKAVSVIKLVGIAVGGAKAALAALQFHNHQTISIFWADIVCKRCFVSVEHWCSHLTGNSRKSMSARTQCNLKRTMLLQEMAKSPSKHMKRLSRDLNARLELAKVHSDASVNITMDLQSIQACKQWFIEQDSLIGKLGFA